MAARKSTTGAKAAAKRTKAAVKDSSDVTNPEVAVAIPQEVPVPPSTGSGATGPFTRLSANVKRYMNEALAGCTAWVSNRHERGKTARIDALRLAIFGTHPISKSAGGLPALIEESGRAGGAGLVARATGPRVNAAFEMPPGRVTGDHRLQSVEGAALIAADLDLGVAGLPTAKLREALFIAFPELAPTSLVAPLGATPEQAALWQRAIVEVCDELKLKVAVAVNDPASRALILSAMPGQLALMHRRQAQKLSADDEALRTRRAALTAEGACPTDEEINAGKGSVAYQSNKERTLQLYRDQQQGRHEYEQLAAEVTTPAAPTAAPAEDRVAQLRQQVEAAQSLRNQWATARDDFNKRVGLTGHVKALQAHLTAAAEATQQAPCPVCSAPVTLDTARAAQLQHAQENPALSAYEAQITEGCRAAEANLAKLEQQLNTALGETAAKATAEVTRQQQAQQRLIALHQRLTSLHEQWTAHLQTLQITTTEALAAFMAALSVPDDESKLVTPHALQKRVDLRAEYDTLAKDEAQHTVEKLQATQFTGLIAATNTALQASLAAITQPIEQEVRRYLPEGIDVRLVLIDPDGASCCRFEVKGFDGAWRGQGAAPGRSWAALSIAVALALAPKGDDVLRVALLDDAELASFSPEARKLVLSQLAAQQREGRIDHVFVACTGPASIPDGYLTYLLD